MNNSQQWSSATPGYIIFLVDQSGSMGEDFSSEGDKSKFTALVINRTINDLILTNSNGATIKDRVFISIIGYGGEGGNSVAEIRSDYLSEFANHPLRMETVKKKISDGAGGLVEITDELPVFIEPITNGLTPMGDAFSTVKELIQSWATKKPDNPAPVIINISDGLPYEGTLGDEPNKTIRESQAIMNLQTNDGNPLIFNIHIGDGRKECGFEEDESELTNDESKLLFKISSIVPDCYKDAARKHDFNLQPNSRGFVSNAGPETLIKFINFGSSGGTDKLA